MPPHDSGWATFLRNHDELSLDKLDEAERKDVFAAFGPEKDMQIYGHGIRRRAASMLGGDGPRLRMAWSLMLTLPGTPVILYGDEIGMVEDLAREGRMAVRVPMEWERGRGPSAATTTRCSQFMSKLLHRRHTRPSSAGGESRLLENEPPALFAHRCDWQGSTVFALHNLSDEGSPPSSTSATTSTASTTCSSCRDHHVEGGRLQRRARRLRLPVVARDARELSRRRAPRPRPRRRAAALVGRQPQLRAVRPWAWSSNIPCAPGSPGGGSNRLSRALGGVDRLAAPAGP